MNEKTKQKSKLLKVSSKVLLIIIGAMITAYGLEAVLIPNNVSDGGVTGLSIVGSQLFGLPLGLLIGQIQSNQSQGSLQTTGRDLDFALTAKNQYFNVLMTDDAGQTKTAYTRNGAFYVTPTEPGIVTLVNSDGYQVADANGQPITFPDDVKEFTMNSDGTLAVSYPNGQTQNFQLGVTQLQKPQVMESINGGTYIGLPNNLAELGYTEADILTNLQGANRQVGIQKGTLEMSNVDLSQEMTNLIQAQRSYQFNSRAVTIADQMLGLINGIR